MPILIVSGKLHGILSCIGLNFYSFVPDNCVAFYRWRRIKEPNLRLATDNNQKLLVKRIKFIPTLTEVIIILSVNIENFVQVLPSFK